jgi:TPR repeat protein
MLNLNLILARSAGAALLVLATLSACAAPSSYMGISLKPSAVSEEVKDLAARAMLGDKRAQLELGKRFEEGRGLPRNTNKAKHLYRRAATDSGGTIWLYLPATSRGGVGRVVPVSRGVPQKGLLEAKERSERLQ